MLLPLEVGHLWGEDAVVSTCMLGWYLREEPQGGHLWGKDAVVSAYMRTLA